MNAPMRCQPSLSNVPSFSRGSTSLCISVQLVFLFMFSSTLFDRKEFEQPVPARWQWQVDSHAAFRAVKMFAGVHVVPLPVVTS